MAAKKRQNRKVNKSNRGAPGKTPLKTGRAAPKTKTASKRGGATARGETPVGARPPIAATPAAVRPPTAAGPRAPVVTRPPVDAGPIVVGPAVPFPHAPSHVGNFFDKDRAGRPVVRPDDLVVLRLEFDGLVIQPGDEPRLRKPGAGDAFIVLHFPPQAITERSFFETKPQGTTTNPPPPPGVPDKPESGGGGSEPLEGPPVRARIAGESRLVFKVPDGFEIDYTLEGV